ncbi:hypothetical protein [Paraglaciecola sp. 25GB23A]|uniref:hypothetical protein n=1 Tax=Paraglaciecola sp. 25GB23A TaxID=3156068 RepID=UPI0032AF8C08
MNNRQLIKHHLIGLSLHELLRYRLLFCASQSNEDIELDIKDLFKHPGRLQTSYVDNWLKDILRALFIKLDGELCSLMQVEKSVSELLNEQLFTAKDQRTLSIFEDFLASENSDNVVFLHQALQQRLNKN